MSMPSNQVALPLLHGTNSKTLAIMLQEELPMMSALSLVTIHQLAPLTGELRLGGYRGLANIDCPPCFGSLTASSPSVRKYSYTFPKILRSYAARLNDSSLQQTEKVLNELTKMYQSSFYSNINLILIYAARYQLLGGDLKSQESLQQVRDGLQDAIILFDLYVMLHTHLQINPVVLTANRDPKATMVLPDITADHVLALAKERGIDITAAKEIMSTATIESLMSLFPVKINSEEHPLFIWEEKTPVKKQGMNLPFDSIIGDKSWLQKAITAAIKKDFLNDNYVPAAADKISSYRDILKQRLETLDKLLALPTKALEFDKPFQCLVSPAFPIMFLSNADDKFESIGLEYRSNTPLTLGKDIIQIAVSDERDLRKVKTALTAAGITMDVVLFKELWARHQTYVEDFFGQRPDPTNPLDMISKIKRVEYDVACLAREFTFLNTGTLPLSSTASPPLMIEDKKPQKIELGTRYCSFWQHATRGNERNSDQVDLDKDPTPPSCGTGGPKRS